MSPNAQYTSRKTGEPYTKNYRVYLTTGKEVISPWHDIPLFPNAKESHVVNMVVEIPRWSNVKMEIGKDEFLTPIRRDIRDDRLCYIPNIFPHKGYPWNYGALPQTWEDPNLPDPHTQLPGDSDPLDVCELAGDIGETGAVKRVKVIGAFAVVDDGKTDWKVVVVDVSSPLAASLNDIGDVETHMPGYLATMQEWFRVYKIPAGARENEMALDGEIKGREFALALITRCHGSWKKVMTEPAMKTKVSMADIGIEDNNLAQQLRPETAGNGLALADRFIVEKYHFLTPNWPLAASCPGRTIDI